MKNIQFSSVLLFCLLIPFIMMFSIGPGQTPYWLFGIIFFLLLGYIVLDLVQLKDKTYELTKKIVLWLIIVVVIGSSFVSAIIVRHQSSPIYQVHDIVVQQEAAVRYLIHGKNPYKETYFGTPLEQWNYSDKEINPALYHFVMEPFYLIFAVPFYFVANHTVGFFDGRMPLLFLFIVSAIIGMKLIEDEKKKLLFLTIFIFNPAMLPYILEGRSDIFMYAFFIASILFLDKKKFVVSSIFLALAFCVKQSIWPIFPFFVAYLLFTVKNKRTIFYSIISFSIVFLVITMPFYFWDPKAYMDSTIYYLSGQTVHSYPISGYGFGRVLLDLHVIKDSHAYYPFLYWQIAFCLPLLVILLYYLKKNPSLSRFVVVYGIFLFVYWYFSRYFHNSHLGFLTLVFITAYFLEKKNPNYKKQ